ncbi:DUF2958 domain-containing protein [Epibacterium sp. MM17-32]|uniref:DUF2958 domain-containing protein n=1 Tax=Epibacterium sp. MM17-32 TaxID=2917734 RepID=UPI001EF5CB5A|nr:DUF2958 domain-containing protein [Epibacterium sp. MM17-32]MCG7629054.1 DUF2958 domain-containing protein [Epibacterium sp. MM17-32]
MKLITKELKRQLLKNGAAAADGIDTSDCQPVLKIFCPWGAATWLFSEMDPENPDILFGLCDLGHGTPELGGVSLSELESVSGPAGLKLERDRWFSPDKTLSEYADEARAKGRLVV